MEFRGVVDLIWRLGTKDGRFKLVDFKPRLGAQFRFFQAEGGIDFVRALHPDRTGRSLHNDPPVTGRRFIVEHLDAAAHMAYRPERTPSVADHPYNRTEFAWISWDDPADGRDGYPPALDGPEQTFCASSDHLPRRFVVRIGGCTTQIGWVPKPI